MKTVSCRFALISLVALSACSFLSSFHDDYDRYKDFIYNRVVEARLFTEGEQKVAVKAIPATAELKEMQEKVAPGFSFALNPEREQVVIAVSPQNRIPFISDDLKFLLGGNTPLQVRELTASFVIETFYPYAYPYYRVFMVEFPKSAAQSGTLQVLTSRGRLMLSLNYGNRREDAKL